MILPFFVGMVWDLGVKKEERNWVLTYLYGCLTEIVVTGVVAMPYIKFRAAFSVYRITSFAVLGVLGILGLVGFVHSMRQKTDNWRIRLDREKMDWFAWLGVIVVFGMLASCYFQYVPVISSDMTAETIHTTLLSNTLFEYNPATGELLQVGMYPQDKLLTLPLFYSLFYGLGIEKVTGMSGFLYQMVPIWTLFLNFLVFWKWAEYLFLGQKKVRMRRPVFLCFYGAINLFGDYLFITFSYKLLHQAWMGETIFVVILLPFLALQWISVAKTERTIKEWRYDFWKKREWIGPVLCSVAGFFCVPWREAFCLEFLLMLGSGVAAIIWRKYHERTGESN